MFFEGAMYNDDRMYLVHLCKGVVTRLGDGTIETKVYHDESPRDYVWCLATYRNVSGYPATRVDRFRSLEDARVYLERVEPTVPLVSLGGKSPQVPLSYERFAEWKRECGLVDYEFPGASRFQDLVSERTETFLQSSGE